MAIRVALFILATASVTAGSQASTIEDFEKAAASQRFLDLGCVLYDRMDRQRDCADQAGAELLQGDYPISELEALTKHRTPASGPWPLSA